MTMSRSSLRIVHRSGSFRRAPSAGLGSGALTDPLLTDPLERLHFQIESAVTEPYLLTVTVACSPHSSCTSVEWDNDRIRVPAPSGWEEAVAQGHLRVTLLWPPAESGGYSLIVDGIAANVTADGEPRLEVTPTRAVLHRRGTPASSSGSPCRSDCIPVLAG